MKKINNILKEFIIYIISFLLGIIIYLNVIKKYLTFYHAYDSNDIKKYTFKIDNIDYNLEPYIIS